jgi:glycosyltransferase involved in cell wall biosynthesis
MWNMLQGLKQAGCVDVVAFQDTDSAKLAQLYAGCNEVVTLSKSWLTPTALQRRAYQSTRGRLSLVLGTPKPYSYAGPSNQRLMSWFARFVRSGRYDIIWMEKAATAVALGWKDPRRTILDGIDFYCVLEFHLLRTSAWYHAKVLNYLDVLKLAWWEWQLPRWFARVVRCSEADRRRLPHPNVVVVPNGTSIPPACPRAPGQRLVFVGALGYEPNRAGIEWFLKEVWPRVRRAVPSAELDAVGNNPSPQLLSRHGTEGVHVHGFVSDLTPVYERAAGSIAPLLAGAGTRLKILESLSRGVPVVSTQLGAYGLDLGAQDGVFLADRPEDFASRCVELLLDSRKANSLGQRGREAVAACYDWEKIQRRVQDIARAVALRPRGAAYPVAPAADTFGADATRSVVRVRAAELPSVASSVSVLSL